MRRVVVLVVVLSLVPAACGGGVSDADVGTSLARLGGEVCRRDLFAAGVFIEEDLVLTAAHSVAGADGGVRVETLDGRSGAGVVVGFDPERDLALLRVSDLSGRPLRLGNANVGDAGSIWTIDRDLKVERVPYEVERLINATGDDIYGEGDVSRPALQLAAAIDPGMSGAPVVGDDASVLGIVFADSRNASRTYAVATAAIEAFLAEVDAAAPVTPGRCR